MGFLSLSRVRYPQQPVGRRARRGQTLRPTDRDGGQCPETRAADLDGRHKTPRQAWARRAWGTPCAHCGPSRTGPTPPSSAPRCLDTTCDAQHCSGPTLPYRQLGTGRAAGTRELSTALASPAPVCTEAEWIDRAKDDPDACRFIRLAGDTATADWGENRLCDVTHIVGGSMQRLPCPPPPPPPSRPPSLRTFASASASFPRVPSRPLRAVPGAGLGPSRPRRRASRIGRRMGGRDARAPHPISQIRSRPTSSSPPSPPPPLACEAWARRRLRGCTLLLAWHATRRDRRAARWPAGTRRALVVSQRRHEDSAARVLVSKRAARSNLEPPEALDRVDLCAWRPSRPRSSIGSRAAVPEAVEPPHQRVIVVQAFARRCARSSKRT